MIRIVVLIALGIVFFGPAFVNAAPGAQPSKQAKQTAKKHHELALAEFINKVVLEGEDNNLGQNISRVLGLEPDHKSKVFEKLEGDCGDNRYRTVNVVVEKVPETDRLKPVSVILQAKRTRPGVGEVDYFRLDPDGGIGKAFRTSVKMTPDGHGVPGSAVNVDFDPDEAKTLLKRELDFWLKGIGLKKKPAELGKAQASGEGKPADKPSAAAPDQR